MFADCSQPRETRCAGISLIELMVVLAIAAILLSVGVPVFSELMLRQKATTVANEFVGAIHLTRSEAIHRGTRVDLVPADGDWKKGWVVFVDENNNQSPDVGEHVVYMHGEVPTGLEITSKLTDTDADYVAYNGTGRTRTNNNPMQPLYGSIRIRLGQEKRNIVINMLGRTRVCTPKSDSETC